MQFVGRHRQWHKISGTKFNPQKESIDNIILEHGNSTCPSGGSIEHYNGNFICLDDESKPYL